MVFLTIAIIVLAIILWTVSSHTDPHHAFFVSLLPLLDIEHAAGTGSDFKQNDPTHSSAARVA